MKRSEMSGFIKIYRSMFSHWLWGEERVFSKAEAWIDLLRMAAFVPTKRMVRDKLIHLDQGEIVASLRFLGTRWMWGKDKVATFLRCLESDGMIRRSVRQREGIIYLINYKAYANAEHALPDTDPHEPTTSDRRDPDKVEEGIRSKRTPTPPEEPVREVASHIMQLRPAWQRPAALTATEMESLTANMDAFESLKPDDWDLIAEFLAARLPDGSAYWQPRNRSKFIETLGDVMNSADRWRSKQQRRPPPKPRRPPPSGPGLQREELAEALAILNGGNPL